METVESIALRDPGVFPDLDVLRETFGKSFGTYEKLLEMFAEHELKHEWRYYRDGKAWLCKVQRGTKTIIWMSAWKGYAKATIYVSEKHLAGVYDLPIAQETVQHIRETGNVGKSKPCTFELRSPKVLKDLETVITYKITTK